jgi:hypothetical protein
VASSRTTRGNYEINRPAICFSDAVNRSERPEVL